MTDCLLIVLADRREWWFDAQADLIVKLPREDQRKAWVVVIAKDLCLRTPGLPRVIAAAPLLDRLRLSPEVTR